MTEIGGEAAGYVDPANPVSAAATIAQGLLALDQMSAQGLSTGKKWDVSRMFEDYEMEYAQVLAARAPASLPVASA